MQHKKAIVIGAGIVGLATARSLAERSYEVTVFERNDQAIGASVRNFGMIWPIGQPNGTLYERALVSRFIWKMVCTEAGLWHEQMGSLHAASSDLEWQVMQEYVDINHNLRPVAALNPAQALAKSAALNPANLKGALWSADEMIIESRVAMQKLPAYLKDRYGIQFHFNTAVTGIEFPSVISGKKRWEADLVFVCSGEDFETLYPEIFTEQGFHKCKLQMMRLTTREAGWRIGPSLCGGLSLIHYKSFEVANSLQELKTHFLQTMPDYLKWGIHVMVSQNAEGELTVGDSHEYGKVHDPFNRESINRFILDYLARFTVIQHWQLLQTWNGIYPKTSSGQADFVHSPEPGVTIVNGLGGAGMTLSFGLAEEVISRLL